jgi:serine/threonine-protein kinase
MSEQELAALLDNSQAVTVGRYILHRQIARGGMATIHIARLMGDEGFSRIVAAKRLLPEFAEDSEFVAMFLDEARIASKVHHRNVVPVLDVVTAMDEVVLVQEYVHGAPLHWLLNKARATRSPVPVDIAVSIASQVLAGLHAAHEMVDEMGVPLNVVHRDVSPQNVMVASDGTARLLDFGVAKASMSAHVTREGTYKGKLAYSAPEQLRGSATRQSDIYSLGVLLWELLVGHRMHGMQSETELIATIMNGTLPTITETLAAEHEWAAIDERHWQQLAALEPIVKRALAVNMDNRWKTAAEMDDALTAVVRPASSSVVATWLKGLGREYLEKNDKVLAAEEASWRKTGQSSFRRNVPSELRRLGSVADRIERSVRSEEPVTSYQAAPVMPMMPERRGPYAMIALLSLLVIALAMGIVIIASGPTSPPAAAASTAPAPPPASAAPPEILPVAHAKQAPLPVHAEEVPTAVVEATTTDSISIGQVESHPTTPSAAQTPVRKQVRQPSPPPRPVTKTRTTTPTQTTTTTTKVADPKPAVTAPASEVAAPAAASSPNCTPPYYYEGSKKIFKPACL